MTLSIAARTTVAATFLLAVGAMSRANEIKGKVAVQGIKSAENIVVYVDAIPGQKLEAPKDHVVIDQRKMSFIPHVAAVQQGTTVDFLNSDPVGHNVYWPSISGNKKLAHNLGTWPQGQKKPFQFNDVGTASLLCNVHPEMSGYIVVVPTPYHATSDKSGSYKIENVPDGSYNVTAWHEGAKNQSKPVNVSGDSKADFTLSK